MSDWVLAASGQGDLHPGHGNGYATESGILNLGIGKNPEEIVTLLNG
jgi:hypothetical protein